MNNKIYTYKNLFKSHNISLKKIESLMIHLKKITNIPEEQYYNIMVAISEAVNNAIIHGNKNDPNKKFFFQIIIDNNLIEITVKDQGSGFNPDKIEDPRQPENLLKETGRGIFLIRSLMDSVEFKVTESGTELKMTYIIK
jgi:serine/threonine-protein kinase RsbW